MTPLAFSPLPAVYLFEGRKSCCGMTCRVSPLHSPPFSREGQGESSGYSTYTTLDGVIPLCHITPLLFSPLYQSYASSRGNELLWDNDPFAHPITPLPSQGRGRACTPKVAYAPELQQRTGVSARRRGRVQDVHPYGHSIISCDGRMCVPASPFIAARRCAVSVMMTSLPPPSR